MRFDRDFDWSLRNSGKRSMSGIGSAVLLMSFLQQHSHAGYKRGENNFRTDARLRRSVHSFVILTPLTIGLEVARRQVCLDDHRGALERCRVRNLLPQKTPDFGG